MINLIMFPSSMEVPVLVQGETKEEVKRNVIQRLPLNVIVEEGYVRFEVASVGYHLRAGTKFFGNVYPISQELWDALKDMNYMGLYLVTMHNRKSHTTPQQMRLLNNHLLELCHKRSVKLHHLED